MVARTTSSTPSGGEHEEIVLYQVREPVHREAQPPLPLESTRARWYEGPYLEAAQVIAPRAGAVDRGPVLSLALDRGAPSWAPSEHEQRARGGLSCSKLGRGSGSLRIERLAPHFLASGSSGGRGAPVGFAHGRVHGRATLENGCHAGGIRGLAFCGDVLVVGRDPGRWGVTLYVCCST